MKRLVSMREALNDPHLLGKAIAGDSWEPWRVLLMASFGEALTSDERAIFTMLTGREREPTAPVAEFWGIAGRRSGKTRAAGVLGAYLAVLCDHSDTLASGERATLPVLATNTTQASRAFNHISGVLNDSPILSQSIVSSSTDTIKLASRVDIEVRPANFRTIRGITAIGAIADEIAFWLVDGTANPDAEILNAVRPSLATTGGPLFCISSPYARRGELFGMYRRHWGPAGDTDVIVAKGASKVFNSTLSDKVIARAYERDAAAASAEFGGEFRADIEAFINRETVLEAIDDGVRERPFTTGNRYNAFVDPSGGSSDSMTLAIAHRDGTTAVLDAVREVRPPFSPEAVVIEFADLIKSYGLREVTGDRYAGEWPRERFRTNGITYNLSDQNRSELYLSLIPLLNSGNAALLDHDRLTNQLTALERRKGRSGRDSIDHPPGAHDDIANAAAGALVRATARSKAYTIDDLRAAMADDPPPAAQQPLTATHP